MIKRLFDFLSSAIALVLLFPFFIVIALLIISDSKGGVFYKQERIGQFGKPFLLFKFRTMQVGADQKGLITIGERDSRTTKVGYYLRKYKIDEIPQIINILINQMSVVGPRPEVAKYVKCYNQEQRKVLDAKPGLTDLASLAYFNENEILGKADDPEKVYIEEIMPEKLNLNLAYIEKQNFWFDLKIIIQTIKKIFQ